MSSIPIDSTIWPKEPEEIYAFVKDYQDLSDEPLRIDPVTEKFLFIPVLESIIENPDTPLEIQCTASDMWYFAFYYSL